jgi:hypothetical protein
MIPGWVIWESYGKIVGALKLQERVEMGKKGR